MRPELLVISAGSSVLYIFSLIFLDARELNPLLAFLKLISSNIDFVLLNFSWARSLALHASCSSESNHGGLYSFLTVIVGICLST